MDKDFVITLRLRADQVNLLLNKLSLCPFSEVVEVIGAIKSQGDAALAHARQTSEQAATTPGNGLSQTATP